MKLYSVGGRKMSEFETLLELYCRERKGGGRSIAVCSATNLTQPNVRLNCSLGDQKTATNQDICRGREGKSPRIPNLDTTWNRFLPPPPFSTKKGGLL